MSKELSGKEFTHVGSCEKMADFLKICGMWCMLGLMAVAFMGVSAFLFLR